MIELLAIIGGGTTAAALGAIIWLAYKLARGKDSHLSDLKTANKTITGARDHIERMDEQLDDLVKERDGLTVELAAKTEELRIEHELRLDVEKQRDEAQQKEREYVVQMLKSANVADANQFLAHLLATPLAGGVPKAVPRSEEPTSGDGLIKPDDL